MKKRKEKKKNLPEARICVSSPCHYCCCNSSRSLCGGDDGGAVAVGAIAVAGESRCAFAMTTRSKNMLEHCKNLNKY
jgi:hypothetical protein